MARSLKQHFTDWCRQQGDAKYDYFANKGCAFCNFLRDNGYAKDPIVGGYGWSDDALDEQYETHRFDDQLVEALQLYPRTYAALADRLAA